MAGQAFYFTTPQGYSHLDNIVAPPNGATLTNVGGFNASAYDRYLMLFAKDVSLLAVDDLPILAFQVKQGASFSYASVSGGLKFVGGCCYAVSDQGSRYVPTTVSLEWWVYAEGRTL
jgi:hypothetical protein